MFVTVREESSGEWAVWIQLEEGNPTEQGESFIFGVGDTREAAMLDATTELHRAIDVVRVGGGSTEGAAL